jgi:prepilin-type N-terminal cleavage/methylation domain-containing protein
MGNAGPGFSLIELLVAIAAVTVPLVIKFADTGQSGARNEEEVHVQNAINTWTGLPTKSSAPIKADGFNTDLSDYMRMENDQTTYYYWNFAAKVSVYSTAQACP